MAVLPLRGIPRALGAAIRRVSAATLLFAAPALAQTWTLGSTSVDLPTSADGDCNCPTPADTCSVTGSAVVLPGFLGNDFVWVSEATCTVGGIASACGCEALGGALVQLDGLGTNTVRIRWDALAWADHDCRQGPSHTGPCGCPSSYETEAEAEISFGIDLGIAGLPPETPVTVFYRWNQVSANMFNPEELPDDSSSVGGGVSVGGTSLFGGSFNLVNRNEIRSGPGTGSFGTMSEMTVTVSSIAVLAVKISDPASGTATPCIEHDSESTAWGGELVLSLFAAPSPPADVCSGIPALEFSLDIASASELSDPGADFNDRFDPGDRYLAGGPPLPLGGADGAGDDTTIFTGFDPPPATPDGPPAASAAPVCVGVPPVPIFFDLDAIDSLDVSLIGMIPPGPLPAPIPRFPSACVHDARYLVLSYDDDGGGHYFGVNPGSGLCEVPTLSPSPGGWIRGSAALRDEIVGALLVLTPAGAAAGTYPIASEAGVHTSLRPNPVPASFASVTPEDDDVDALEVNDGGCPASLLSFDHEADAAVLFPPPGPDPGAIYQVTPAGAVPVIDDVVHLGIPEDADLDAFELVFTPDIGGTGDVLCLLFSVADEDPLVPGDQSGGLDPAMIYGSYLTGTSFPFLTASLPDDVDALSAWCVPFVRQPQLVTGRFLER